MYNRDDKWDIITAKIISAINNRLEDVRLSVNKMDNRIAHIEQEMSIHSSQQLSNSNRIEEVNDSLTTCISKIEEDVRHIKTEFSQAIVDKTNTTVDKCVNEALPPSNTSLNDREQQVVTYIKDYGKITNRAYCELFTIPRRTALRELNDLVNKGILKKQGKGRSVHYVLAQLIFGAIYKDNKLFSYELAFYDALAQNASAKQVMGTEKLKELAIVLVDRVRKSATIDWNIKESARAKLKVLVKRLLRKYGYPPDMQALATETVLEQTKLFVEFEIENQ